MRVYDQEGRCEGHVLIEQWEFQKEQKDVLNSLVTELSLTSSR